MLRSLLLLNLLFTGLSLAGPARITRVQPNEKLVTADERGLLWTFRVADAVFFKEGSWIDLDFSCVRDARGDCDNTSPFVLKARAEVVQAVRREFTVLPGKMLIHHAPGDSRGRHVKGLVVSGHQGEVNFSMNLLMESGAHNAGIVRLRRGQKIRVMFPKNEPYRVVVNGVPLVITTFISVAKT
jgi:hypothetical protein